LIDEANEIAWLVPAWELRRRFLCTLSKGDGAPANVEDIITGRICGDFWLARAVRLSI
jgi:hypothetical protein